MEEFFPPAINAIRFEHDEYDDNQAKQHGLKTRLLANNARQQVAQNTQYDG